MVRMFWTGHNLDRTKTPPQDDQSLISLNDP